MKASTKRVVKTTVTYALMGLAVGLCSEYAKSIYDDASADYGDMAPDNPVAEEQETETEKAEDTSTE